MRRNVERHEIPYGQFARHQYPKMSFRIVGLGNTVLEAESLQSSFAPPRSMFML